jgi:hypothetical protein
MSLWYRIFAGNAVMPEEIGIERCLASSAVEAKISWASSSQGWYRGDIALEKGISLVLERWLADEEGIRGELNTWAGYLETCPDSPHRQTLMERTIQAKQLFTLRRPIDPPHEELIQRTCVALSQHLAKLTEGFYQADEHGFFAAGGMLLVSEE